MYISISKLARDDDNPELTGNAGRTVTASDVSDAVGECIHISGDGDCVIAAATDDDDGDGGGWPGEYVTADDKESKDDAASVSTLGDCFMVLPPEGDPQGEDSDKGDSSEDS